MHLILVDLRESEPALTGRQAEDRLARDRHHGQPQRRAVRPPAADGSLRPAHRDAGARHARPAASRTSPRWGRILASALTPGYESRAGELAERVAAIVERYPLYEELSAPRRSSLRRGPDVRRTAPAAGLGVASRPLTTPVHAMLSRFDGASERARRAFRLPCGGGGDRPGDSGHDALRASHWRDRRAARAWPIRAPKPLLGGLAIFVGALVAGLIWLRRASARKRRTVARRADRRRRSSRWSGRSTIASSCLPF